MDACATDWIRIFQGETRGHHFALVVRHDRGPSAYCAVSNWLKAGLLDVFEPATQELARSINQMHALHVTQMALCGYNPQLIDREQIERDMPSVRLALAHAWRLVPPEPLA